MFKINLPVLSLLGVATYTIDDTKKYPDRAIVILKSTFQTPPAPKVLTPERVQECTNATWEEERKVGTGSAKARGQLILSKNQGSGSYFTRR